MSNRLSFPLRVLLWESTQRCNAYCEFCGSRCGDVSCLDELTKEEICTVFQQIAENYDASQIMINVTGGEPLLREDLIDIMQYAISLGYHWGLVTNGMLLNENIIARLKETELKTVSISIDGLYETHDSLRGVKGGFNTVIRNLKLLADVDFLETIMITTVVSKKNISELDSIKNLLKSLPINVWRICPVDPIGRADSDSNLILDTDQIKNIFEYISRCRQEDLPFNVTTSCSHYLGKYEFDVRLFPFECNAGKTVGSILANGDIFVCPNVSRISELIQGNVRTHSFVDVWENGFRYFRNFNSRRIGRCEKCKHYSLCQGDSLHTWDYIKKEPRFCMKDYGFEPINESNRCIRRSFSSIIQEIKEGKDKISDALINAQSLSKDIVLITPSALRSIFEYFSWGSKTRSSEKICALLGQIYINSEIDDEAFIVCVEGIICLDSSEATEKTLIIDCQLEEQILQHHSIIKGSLVHIGYMHSHPNELEVSMSLGDFQWHRQMYKNDWKKALTIILNPQKKHIVAYTGPAANPVELHLIGYNECAETRNSYK